MQGRRLWLPNTYIAIWGEGTISAKKVVITPLHLAPKPLLAPGKPFAANKDFPSYSNAESSGCSEES